jgi:hypothetical protein
MRINGPYDESQPCGARTGPQTEEAQMYSQMVQGMAAERTKDLRREAAAAAQARLARNARPARRVSVVASHAGAWLVGRTVHP